jgi:hypothetical protein
VDISKIVLIKAKLLCHCKWLWAVWGQLKFQTTCPKGQSEKNTYVEPYTSQAISRGFEKAVARSGKWIFLRLYRLRLICRKSGLGL